MDILRFYRRILLASIFVLLLFLSANYFQDKQEVGNHYPANVYELVQFKQEADANIEGNKQWLEMIKKKTNPSDANLELSDKEKQQQQMVESWYRNDSSRPLIFINRFGRLGNQMFLYAAAFCIALHTNRTATVYRQSMLFPLFPNLHAQKTDFNLNKEVKERWKEDPVMMKLQVVSPGLSGYNPRVLDQVKSDNRTWLKGTFQSFRYFDQCENTIRKEFTFNSSIQAAVNDMMHSFTYKFTSKYDVFIDDITFVGIHVRRGDYVNESHMKSGFLIVNETYIHRAMNYYTERYKWPLFIAASEDIQWCKDNIKSKTDNLFFSPYDGTQYLYDFVMLSSCNHSITTMGSYGWFAAWLAGGEVVYIRDWFRKGSQNDNLNYFNASDRFPDAWIGF